ncbi:hypothetical protein O181_036760 [Austropuccinia psidii MF-1]|uniref:Uncharacterized protein n=1 Tax=Austropuccinia psidii MF-1 TaxID=1389203 RepID=A0A9Q3D9J7_9BASI|nr:hypothetical protein [Austropuccinia psidii MF-1]
MLADKHTRNVHSLSAPSNHAATGVLTQDALARTPLWSTMMKPYPSADGNRDPKQAKGNYSRLLALSPQVSICPPPLLGHHPMVTSLLDRREVIIRPMKDGDGERTFKLEPIVTMSCQRWDSNAKNKTHQIPPDKTLPFPVCLARKPRGNPLQAQVAPNGWRNYSAPPIPGLSPSSQPPEDVRTREPEPEVAPTQSTGEPFVLFSFSTPISFSSPFLWPSPARPTTPCLIIIIGNTPVGSPLPLPLLLPQLPHLPILFPPPVQSPSHSHNDARQEFTDFDDSLSHRPRIDQPNFVGALPLAPHDSFCGYNSLK